MSNAAKKDAESSTRAQALCAAEAAQARKGFAVTIVDVQGRCSYADIIMIVSTSNDRQTLAVAKSIEDSLREKFSMKPLHREGRGAWSLTDYGDLLVHVFQEDSRAYYDIDQLWSDAPRIAVPALESPVHDPTPTALARRNARS
jgi:ribosome-associated protein